MEVSGYSAEIGRMAGGVMNMVMRSGTNQYHGESSNTSATTSSTRAGFFDESKNSSCNRHQYGATLSRSRSDCRSLYNGHEQDILHVQLGELQADRRRDLHRARAVAAGAARRPFSKSFSITGSDPDK